MKDQLFSYYSAGRDADAERHGINAAAAWSHFLANSGKGLRPGDYHREQFKRGFNASQRNRRAPGAIPYWQEIGDEYARTQPPEGYLNAQAAWDCFLIDDARDTGVEIAPLRPASRREFFAGFNAAVNPQPRIDGVAYYPRAGNLYEIGEQYRRKNEYANELLAWEQYVLTDERHTEHLHATERARGAFFFGYDTAIAQAKNAQPDDFYNAGADARLADRYANPAAAWNAYKHDHRDQLDQLTPANESMFFRGYLDADQILHQQSLDKASVEKLATAGGKVEKPSEIGAAFGASGNWNSATDALQAFERFDNRRADYPEFDKASFLTAYNEAQHKRLRAKLADKKAGAAKSGEKTPKPAGSRWTVDNMLKWRDIEDQLKNTDPVKVTSGDLEKRAADAKIAYARQELFLAAGEQYAAGDYQNSEIAWSNYRRAEPEHLRPSYLSADDYGYFKAAFNATRERAVTPTGAADLLSALENATTLADQAHREIVEAEDRYIGLQQASAELRSRLAAAAKSEADPPASQAEEMIDVLIFMYTHPQHPILELLDKPPGAYQIVDYPHPISRENAVTLYGYDLIKFLSNGRYCLTEKARAFARVYLELKTDRD